ISNPNNPFPNTLVVQFPYPQKFSRCEVALSETFLFYSWYNITAAFGNNTFSYGYPTGNGGDANGYIFFTVVIPDGFYSIDDLSSYFVANQIFNGCYVYSSTDP